MTDGWQDLVSERVRQLEAGDSALTPKALAMLKVIRGYERRVRRVALKADYRLARILPR
jgi:molybdenum-dependent DNA-binding transcriptional regulator ModE